MRRLLSFVFGITIGGAVGLVLVTLFSPVSGREVRQNLRDHYQQALEKARTAAAAKRTELEAELAKATQPDAE